MPIEKLRPSFTFPEDRLKELTTLVPEAFADGIINWDVLRETLGEHLEDEEQEHFGLSWPGKREARRLAAMPSKGTLVPQPGEGVNEDKSRNIFIEGDNLEVLKLLQKSYAGRVKTIYIDPPYNSDKDLIYHDDYKEPLESYLKRTKQTDEKGQLLTSNPKASGRFHSNWLSMMYPRLRIAREFLRSDGVIFISIDDRELYSLRLIMNEIFGEENFLATFIWVNEGNIDNQSKVKQNHEYILCYAREEPLFPASPVIDPNIPETSKLYRDNIENTIVKNGPKNPVSDILLPVGFPANFENGHVEPKDDFWPRLSNPVSIQNSKTQNTVVVSSGWSSKAIFEQFIASEFQPVLDTKGQETTFFITENGAIFNRKIRLENQSHVLTILQSMGTVQNATSQLLQLGLSYDYPKPVELIKYLIQVGNSDDAIVMDFFAGACPTAEAVLRLKRCLSFNSTFICIQLPEPVDPNRPSGQHAIKQGLHTISDVGRERIRRVITQMADETEGQLDLSQDDDLGFKCYHLDRSNFKEWQSYTGSESQQLEILFDHFETPLVTGWQTQNLLTEILLLQGFPLDSLIVTFEAVQNNTVQRIHAEGIGHELFVCLDDMVSNETIKQLHLRSEDIFVCLDSALSDETKIRLTDQCNLKVI